MVQVQQECQFSAKLKGGISHSHSLYAAQYEKKAVGATKAFKASEPSFPTLLEQDMYKYVLDWPEVKE